MTTAFGERAAAVAEEQARTSTGDTHDAWLAILDAIGSIENDPSSDHPVFKA